MGKLEEDMARDWEEIGSEPEKASEIVNAVDQIFTDKTKEQKSNLISRNIRGITRAQSLQAYLTKYYGFRIDVLDALIDSKLLVVKSREGWGTEKLTHLMSTLQSKVETNIGMPQPNIADKLAGKDKR